MTDYIQNLHTHTIYCDGKDSPESLVLKAIEIGFDTIGFSGHSYMGFDVPWHMTKEKTEAYKTEINNLKNKYKNQIHVLCGLEYDVLSDCDVVDYDYIIGSSHFLKMGDEYIEFDVDADSVANIISCYFNGDGMKYVQAYYENMAQLYKYGDFDIVGHFDIVSKHCETHDFFDINSNKYRDFALEALHSLSNKIKVFEVNTGAMSRGYRTAPYPAPFILKEMNNIGCTVVLTSDCHNKNFLNHYYKESIEFIKSCGFENIGVMKDGSIIEVKI
ncbi:MAG: histidinol-phosphatase HisJ family protein [Clostridia bacterium]|nr:histidinol-phosphatase HisJ family protein [Clostridia bacterium]